MDPYEQNEQVREEPSLAPERGPEQILPPPIDPVVAARRQFTLTLFALLFILLASEIIVSIVYYFLRFRFPSVTELPGAMIFISSLPIYLIAMPLSLLFFRKIPKSLPEKHTLSFPSFVGLFCVTLVLTIAGSIAGNVVNTLLTFLTGQEPGNALQTLADDSPLWSQFLFIVILAPIFEEIFYRKLIFDRVRAYGELPAILLCGLLFGLIHGNFYQFFYAAEVGVLFCYIYARTGRIIYTIGLHMLLNFAGTILIEYYNRLITLDPGVVYYAGISLFLLLGICFLLAFAYAIYRWIKERKKIFFEVQEKQLEPNQWINALLGSAATWIFLGVVALLFLSTLVLS